MTEEQIQQAVDAARQARSEFFADHAGVRIALMRMFARYNVEVWFEDVGQPPRKNSDKYVLTLPNDTSSLRDHYTLAHEMGHIIMGHSIDVMMGGGTDEDKQANIFAAEILMPEKEFRDVCRECRNNKFKVASKFGVTPSAAGVRMAILGIEEGKNGN